MITINKNMRWDSMMPSDWYVVGGLGITASPYNTSVQKTGFVPPEGYSHTYGSNAYIDMGYGIKGQGAWALVSMTQEEIDYIMNNSNANYLSSVGTFPMSDQFLLPTISTVNGVSTFEFKDKCVIKPVDITSLNPSYGYPYGNVNNWNNWQMYTALKAWTGVGKGSKYKVPSTYTGHGTKQNFTHLVYVFARATQNDITSAFTTSNAQSIINAGQLYIDTRQFAAFTVGVEGSGADIIMSDTTIAPGKTIFFGNTPDTKIVVSMNTTLDVVQ
jgi:hypothetical protein